MPRIELDLADDDLRLLRGALLAARASELAEVNRRGLRHSLGHGTDSARGSMTAEIPCRPTGVFVDPDGHPWKVAHNPYWSVADDGSVTLGS